ncbi:NUDIX hydrolase [Paenibacillus lactis]|uniref:NUDIX hydrolase n=1 Tax=Paenibacillus TaxID=44249 RepID=UPI00203C12CE|nr:NUDIX hydrolase [Paenibacillus lactis]MCM3496447.1 NUDIX hydrolase [Paenibacillus lactis]
MEKYTHLGIYGVLIRSQRLLLVQKARGPHRGKWDLPGGSVEFGEEPERTLQREFLEETGLSSVQGTIRTAVSYTMIYQYDENRLEELHHIGIIYDVQLADEPAGLKSEGDGEDSLGAAWIPLAQLSGLPLTPFAEMMAEQIMGEDDKRITKNDLKPHMSEE